MNNKLITKNCESQVTINRRRAFTLIELVVAVAILAMVILFSGTIFKASIGSYRTATAQAEIMQKLRAITQQLNSDFKGLRKDAPLFIWFQKGLNGPDDPNRFDQIMFFADGDFQSTRLYSGTPRIPSLNGTPVVGNIARIQYCHARVYSTLQSDYVIPENQQGENNYDRLLNESHRTLARRQHILTADPNIFSWPAASSSANFQASFTPADNNNYEHDKLSLSQWQALAGTTANNNTIVLTCFYIPFLSVTRPTMNLQTGQGLYMLMAQGVGNFSIQWAYLPLGANKFLWWPSIDPDENGSTDDSDFEYYMLKDGFGIHFNAPAGDSLPLWSGPEEAKNKYVTTFSNQFYPSALKFTFTLYDSRGVFKEGQTFTHIVYIGQ